jgi:hypothetical protein
MSIWLDPKNFWFFFDFLIVLIVFLNSHLDEFVEKIQNPKFKKFLGPIDFYAFKKDWLDIKKNEK